MTQTGHMVMTSPWQLCGNSLMGVVMMGHCSHSGSGRGRCSGLGGRMTWMNQRDVRKDGDSWVEATLLQSSS